MQRSDAFDAVILSRRRCALEAASAWLETTDGLVRGCRAKADLPGSQPRFWQFAIPVREVDAARDVLLRQGVETGTTNLMNRAQATGVEMPQARTLKERRIVIRLHAPLARKHYLAMFQSLRQAGRL